MFKKIFFGFLILFFLFMTLILVINYWPYAKSAHGTQYDNVIIFGDSLSDSAPMGMSEQLVGNNYWVTPHGITNPAGAPITSRVSVTNSDRLTWVNYFVKATPFTTGHHFLGIRRNLGSLNPYYENISYAVASAETGDSYIDDISSSPWPVVTGNRCKSILDHNAYSCVPGLLKQVHMYLQDVKERPNKKTLFMLWAGGNDFYQNIVKVAGDDKGESLSHPIHNTVKAVKLLMGHGISADNIYVLNLPNFSMVPAITSLVEGNISNSVLRSMALTSISLISKGYNTWLKSDLVLSTWGKFSSSHVFEIDVLFLEVYNNNDHLHQKLGITEPAARTCVDGKKLPLCKGFLFYNDMHPTTNIHQYLAAQLQSYIE